MRGTRPLTRHGSLNQQPVDEFRYGLLPPMQETAELVRHHRSDVSRLGERCEAFSGSYLRQKVVIRLGRQQSTLWRA